jgi:ankyrin repeat protein
MDDIEENPENMKSMNNRLLWAVDEGEIEICKDELDHGADVNMKFSMKYTPIQIAVERNNIVMCKFLIDHGANVNVSDMFNRTPLFRAVWKNNREISKLLLDSGADMDAVNDEGISPFQVAIISDDDKMVDIFNRHIVFSRRHDLLTLMLMED